MEGIEGSERIGRMMKFFRENLPVTVAGANVTRVIDYIEGFEDIPPQNAIRLFLDNDSWFAIRPSGTEPKIKFYFYSKGDTEKEADAFNRAMTEEILEYIKSVE